MNAAYLVRIPVVKRKAKNNWHKKKAARKCDSVHKLPTSWYEPYNVGIWAICENEDRCAGIRPSLPYSRSVYLNSLMILAISAAPVPTLSVISHPVPELFADRILFMWEKLAIGF
jgi:hypothetical protein